MITKKELEHLAHLARLKLTESELAKYVSQIDEILGYVGQLQKVNLDKNVLGDKLLNFAPLRPDEGVLRSAAEQEDLLSQAPLREGNFIKTRGVFEPGSENLTTSDR